MNSWEQIQKIVDYVELHLEEDLKIEDLAQMAALSPFYFQRLFTKLVKKPVAEYIKLRRLAKSLDELTKTNTKIVDIAFAVGFSSHEHFTRSFKETFGMTPEEYRKNPVRLNFMTKPELLLHYVVVDENVPLVTNGIVLEISKYQLPETETFIGYAREFPVSLLSGLGTESGESELDVMWRNLHELKEKCPTISSHGDEIGVVYASAKEGHFTYYAGSYQTTEELPEGLDCYELPAGEYVVCTFEAQDFEALVMDALYKAQQYVYQTWLPAHKITTEGFCVERYASHDSATTSMELWLKIERVEKP